MANAIETTNNKKQKMDYSFMEEQIIDFLDDFKYVKIYDPKSLEKIYNLYFLNIEEKVILPIEQCYYGIFFYKKEDYDKMKRYYLMAIDKGDSMAMNNLGYYYEKI